MLYDDAIYCAVNRAKTGQKCGHRNKDSEILARMQTPTARAAARALFSVTPKELGEAAVAAAKKKVN